MKNLTLILLAIVFIIACKKNEDTNNINNNNNNIPNAYAKYNFFLSEYGCGQYNNIVKNFTETIQDTATKFYVQGNNIYTFAAKKYRSGGIDITYDYSGYIAKNKTIIYNNLGGHGSAVFGVQEANGSLYCSTGFQIQGLNFGSIEGVNCNPKVYKDGVLIDSLLSPFTNRSYDINGNYVSSKSFGINAYQGLIVKNGDVYVPGMCSDFTSSPSQESFGYWKNGNYVEFYRNRDYSIIADYKLIITDNGDIYYYFAPAGSKYLYKNGVDILYGTLDELNSFDFAVLNNDVYVISGGTIYKNNVIQTTLGINYEGNSGNSKIVAFDNKLFVAVQRVAENDHTTIYEYDTTTKSFIKIGSNKNDLTTCGANRIQGFQVTYK